MGVSAIVACNCFREGKTTAPPQQGHVILDEANEPILDLPYQSNEVDHRAFAEWKKRACPHQDMWLYFERFGSWPGVGLFIDMMETVGWDKFPAIRFAMVDPGSEITPAANARAMLEDLERLISLPRLGEKACLVDAEAGDILAEYIGPRSIRFQARGKIDFELDMGGFVVKRRDSGEESGEELFRSSDFRQLELAEKGGTANNAGTTPRGLQGVLKRLGSIFGGSSRADDSPSTEFIDVKTSESFKSHMSIERETASDSTRGKQSSGSRTRICPLHMRVERRVATPNDFAGQLQVLMGACRASIETNNPIRWS